jgi:hypothetical protein
MVGLDAASLCALLRSSGRVIVLPRRETSSLKPEQALTSRSSTSCLLRDSPVRIAITVPDNLSKRLHMPVYTPRLLILSHA